MAPANEDAPSGCFARLSARISCRRVLGMMVFMGFIFNYMLRVNLSIAIVEMVVGKNVTALVSANVSAADNTTITQVVPESTGKFDWDERVQGIILGCFFWGYITTEVPGGRLAEMIGTKRVFGFSMLGAAVLTVVLPFAAMLSPYLVVVDRVLLGVCLGSTWPSIHPMTARWIPPMERSKFIANMMASSLGVAITFPFCGFLIAYLGWESVFYITGALTLVWVAFWFLLVTDTPQTHPRITKEELEYIETSIGTTTKKGKAATVPWGALLSSPRVWAIVVTHSGSVFGYFALIQQGPTYMKTILKYNIKENGFLSSLPYFGKYFFALFSSNLADYLRCREILTTTATRKVFTALATLVPSILMVVMAFGGDNRVVAVTVFTVALTINGAVTGGYLSNGLDIAPNFSGTIFGIANTLSSVGGFLSSYIIGELTLGNQTFGQWSKMWGLLAGVYAFAGIWYLILGTGKLQPWNTPRPQKGEDNENGDVLKPLNTKNA